MNELQTSLTHYQVKKENGAITVLANKPICVCDHFWDCMNEEWVFAVKCDDGQSRYHIDYLFLDNNFELLNALTEDKGVNPQFLTAQDNTAWVSLSSTSTEREGEIVLPLQNRFRITKEIVRKDLGMDAIFCLNNQCCSYQIDLFNHKKYDKLFVYQFDKNGLYKTRKQYILENIWNGYPTVTRDKCFVTCGKWSNSLCTIHVSEIDENGNILSDWKSEAIADMNSVFLLSYSDTKMEFITFHENHVAYLVYSFEGILLSRKIIYQVETNINLIEKTQIMGGVKAVHCVVSGDIQHFAKNVMLVLGNNTVDVYEAEEGYFPSLLDDSHLLFAPISRIENIACSFKIVII